MRITELLESNLSKAYALAYSLTNRPADAEDAVNTAVADILSHSSGYDRTRPFFPYFAKTIFNALNKQRIVEDQRRQREKNHALIVVNEERKGTEMEKNETTAWVRAALAELPEEERAAVVLTHLQGLTQAEAGEVLGISQQTLSKRVRRGLEKMRRRLTQAGIAEAAVPLALAKLWNEPAPRSIFENAARLAKKAAIKTAATAAVGTACAALLGVSLLFAASSGRSPTPETEAEKTPAQAAGQSQTEPTAGEKEAERKFDTPVWHPEARWERAENWAGTGISSNLDGPRREVMWRSNLGNFEDPIAFDPQGGPFGLRGYDPTTERIHFIAGSGRGSMDGPFSRARWGGQGYVDYPSRALSPDRRFQVRTDPKNGGAVRILDFKEQMIRTALPPRSGAQAMVINSKGEVLILLGKGRLVTIDPAAAKATGEITLKATEGLNLGNGRGLALDEKRNRLYASGAVVNQGGKNWHVWYFDLNDGGSFHGVLPAVERLGPNAGYAGPFDTYKGYAEQGIAFGPDDPDCRFLYMRCTDTGTFMRLDLEKRVVAACSGAPKGKTEPVMFIETGTPNGTIPHAGPIWLPGGDFIMMGLRSGPAPYFRRVK
jgi:RNA polymerase sigma-70 factor (ECF subfamily)